MKVLYTGVYNRAYARNIVMRRGLEKNGVDVIECWIDPAFSKIRQCRELISRLSKTKTEIDVIIAAEMNHRLMPMIWLFSRLKKTPLVFDPFVSQYDSTVFDRKTVRPRSLRALYYYYIDKISMQLADILLADTNEHKKYFIEKFNITKKIFVIPISANEQVFRPVDSQPSAERKTSKTIKICFWGNFIPLQGIQYLMAAAEILKNEKSIQFYLAGDGQAFSQMNDLRNELSLSNVHLLGNVEQEKLPDLIGPSDICLGIFGDTPKTKRVIPNKVYEAMAMGKPIITGDTSAIRELPDVDKCLYLVPVANGQAIANAIMKLAVDEELRETLGRNSLLLFRNHLTNRHIGEKMKNIITSLCTNAAY